jgi:RNA polymerase sigma-70 factor (ECF subfamily)
VTPASPQIEREDQAIDMTSTTALAELADLYERHYEAVFRAALRVTGNPADAEDVLQTVFLRVLARGGDVAATSRPSAFAKASADKEGLNQQASPSSELTAAYFRRAAVNAAVDLLRRRAVRAEAVYDDEAPHAASEHPLLLKERLRRAIATLDGEDATLFLLRHVEGLSIEELAALFGIDKNNVGVRLHRIRRRLQVEMER